ncbi:hypothetical protein D3C73_1675030 [compost metagenome]
MIRDRFIHRLTAGARLKLQPNLVRLQRQIVLDIGQMADNKHRFLNLRRRPLLGVDRNRIVRTRVRIP